MMYHRSHKRLCASILVCVNLLLWLSGCQKGGSADQSEFPDDLSVEYGQASSIDIGYDRAVELLAQQNGMDEKIGTHKLAILQQAVDELDRAAAQADGTALYRLLSQPVSIPGADMDGVLTALVVTDAPGQDGSGGSRLLLVGAPVASIGSDRFQWVHMAGSAQIAYDQASAHLSSSGYIRSQPLGEQQGVWLSDTLYLEMDLAPDML